MTLDVKDPSEPQMEFEPYTKRTHQKKLAYFRILEWLLDLSAGLKKAYLFFVLVNTDYIKQKTYKITCDITQLNFKKLVLSGSTSLGLHEGPISVLFRSIFFANWHLNIC